MNLADFLPITFTPDGTDWSSLQRLSSWCRLHKLSIGPSDITGTRAIIPGTLTIAKWRNLTAPERAGCPYIATQDGRGPRAVWTVRINPDHKEEAA